MERGDIVVCVDDAGAQDWLKVNRHYTVREYLPHGSINKATGLMWLYDDLSGAVMLEELRALIIGCRWELPFRASRFRKVDTMDLTALMEEKEVENVVA